MKQERRGSIPDDIRPVIFDMYFKQNKKDYEIVEYLKEAHNITIHKGSIYKIMAKEKARRAEISREVLKENIKVDIDEVFSYLTQDIRNYRKLYEEKIKLIPDEQFDFKSLLKLKEMELKMIEIVLRSHGLLDNEKGVSEAINKLNEKLGL